MKKIVCLLCFSLCSVLAFAQTQPSDLPKVGDRVDLRLGDCTLVRPGVIIHFKIKMVFDRSLPLDTGYDPRPTFQWTPTVVSSENPVHILPLQQRSFQHAPETDEWDYVAEVGGTAIDGDYQMTQLKVTARYPGADGTLLFAPANLTPEAQRQIAGYRICVRHGFIPVGQATGKILSVGSPK
jgi:hypothetical protein